MTTTIQFTNDSTTTIELTSLQLDQDFTIDLLVADVYTHNNQYEAWARYHGEWDSIQTRATLNGISMGDQVYQEWSSRQNIGYVPEANDVRASIQSSNLQPNKRYHLVFDQPSGTDQWVGIPFDITQNPNPTGDTNLTGMVYHWSSRHCNAMWMTSFVNATTFGESDRPHSNSATAEVIKHGVQWLTNHRKPSGSLKILIYTGAAMKMSTRNPGLMWYSPREPSTYLQDVLESAGHEVHYNDIDLATGEQLPESIAWQKSSDRRTTLQDYPADYFLGFDVVMIWSVNWEIGSSRQITSIGDDSSGLCMTSKTLQSLVTFANEPSKGLMFWGDHHGDDGWFSKFQNDVTLYLKQAGVFDRAPMQLGKLFRSLSLTKDRMGLLDPLGDQWRSENTNNHIPYSSTGAYYNWDQDEEMDPINHWTGNSAADNRLVNGVVIQREKYNEFLQPVEARYMRFYSIDGGSVSMEYYGERNSTGERYGLARDLPDSAWSATSMYLNLQVHAAHQASYKHQHANGIWAPAQTQEERLRGEVYCQVDLGQLTHVHGIGTKGRNSTAYWNQWCSEYMIKSSVDGINWFLVSPNAPSNRTDSNDDMSWSPSLNTPLYQIKDMPAGSRVYLEFRDGFAMFNPNPIVLLDSDQPISVHFSDQATRNMSISEDSILVKNQHLTYIDSQLDTPGVIDSPVTTQHTHLHELDYFTTDQHVLSITTNDQAVLLPYKMRSGSSINVHLDGLPTMIKEQGVYQDLIPSLRATYNCPATTDGQSVRQLAVNFVKTNTLHAPMPEIYICWLYQTRDAPTYVKLTRERLPGQFPASDGFFYVSDTVHEPFAGDDRSGKWQLVPGVDDDAVAYWKLQYKPVGFGPGSEAVDVIKYTSTDHTFIDEYSYYIPSNKRAIESQWSLLDDSMLTRMIDSTTGEATHEFMFTYSEPIDSGTPTYQSSTSNEVLDQQREDVISNIQPVHRFDRSADGLHLGVFLDLENTTGRSMVFQVTYTSTAGDEHVWVIPHTSGTNRLDFSLDLSQTGETLGGAGAELLVDDENVTVGRLSRSNSLLVTPRDLNSGGVQAPDYSTYMDSDPEARWVFANIPLYQDWTRARFGQFWWNQHHVDRGDQVPQTTCYGFSSQLINNTLPGPLFQLTKPAEAISFLYAPETPQGLFPRGDDRVRKVITDTYSKTIPGGTSIIITNDANDNVVSLHAWPGEEITTRSLGIPASGGTLTITTTIGEVIRSQHIEILEAD